MVRFALRCCRLLGVLAVLTTLSVSAQERGTTFATSEEQVSASNAEKEDKPNAEKEDKPKTLSEKDVKKLIDDAIKADRKKQKEKADEAKKKADEEKKQLAQQSTEIGSKKDLKPTWKSALFFASPDNVFKVHVGGRIHTDGAWYNTENAVENGAGGVGTLRDGVNFRRARIRVNGSMFEQLDWLMEYGFESGSPAFFDVYTQMRDLPYLGDFRVGHFREPFSMDALTGGNQLTLIERSLIQDAFVPFRNVGVLFTNTAFDDSLSWAIGGFRSNSNVVGFDSGDRNYAVTGRLTLNSYDECSKGALHLGVAGSHRNLPLRNAAGALARNGLPRTRLSTRPEMRPSAPRLVDTGFFVAEQQQLLGVEFGYGMGPVVVQAEYVFTWLRNVIAPGQTSATAFFHGGYAQVGYFLTGESRSYNRSIGIFNRAKTHERFFWVQNECDPCSLCGMGAWEVAARYSYIDLSDNGITGGQQHDVTLGLNWHWNPNCRWMFNYILAWRDAVGNTSDGLTRILGARFQLDF